MNEVNSQAESLQKSEISIKELPVEGTNNYNPQFGPDGNSIIYTSQAGIYSYTFENSTSQKLLDHEASAYRPLVLSGGKYIVYRKDEFINRRKLTSVIVKNTGNGEERIVVENKRNISTPVKVSENSFGYMDGEKFRVKTVEGNESAGNNTFAYLHEGEIVISRQGRENRINSEKEKMLLEPSLSPDKQKLAYIAAGEGLKVTDLEGNSSLTISGTASAQSPAWSPDGKYIAYALTEDDGHNITSADIYVTSVEDTAKINLTGDFEEPALSPEWAPDGSKIVFHTPSGKIYTAEFEG